jgi:alpha-tubulin suppressor-like RCC1 family protein
MRAINLTLRFLAGGLALSVAPLLSSCKDAMRPDGTGSIVLEIFLGPGSAAAPGVSGAPALPAGHLTSATATAVGPTTKTITLTAGASNFTGTITDLPVGSYTVMVQGFVGTEVDYYGETGGVSVTANSSTTASIVFQSFVPPSVSFPAPITWSFRPALTIGAVPNATSYVIEVDRTSSFPSPAKTTVSSTSGSFIVSDTGTYYVRVRAANSTVPNGGRASNTTSVRVTTDLRPSGTTFQSATALGFFGSSRAVTLDSLNIYPASNVDWFSLSDCNGDSLIITAQALRLSPASPLNSVLALFSGASGRLIAFNDDGDSTDARIRFLTDADGSYQVAVAGSRNTVGHYKLVLQSRSGPNNQGTACKVQPLAVTAVAAGLYHTCSVRATGIVDCWGWNSNGQLGIGATNLSASSSPLRVASSQTFSAVTAGARHTCALTSTGSAYCWGYNVVGQLGDGSATDRAAPVQVTGGQTFSQLAAGDFHTCGLTSGGLVYCWGFNNAGQLGNNSTTNASAPVPVSGGLTFQAVGAGSQHTCGLTTGGSVYCWGQNSGGQLGNGSTANSSVPVFVGSGYNAIAVGGFHTCARTTTNTVNCWGLNAYGGLGNGTTTSSLSPTAVSGGFSFAGISAGRYHTCGVVGTTTYCWGYNFDGQVGDGSTSSRLTPTPVSSAVTFTAVSAGGFHVCGVKATTFEAYCWGWNGFGQLGTGTALEHTGPVPIAGSLVLDSIALGNEHTCALSAGSVYCWGWNSRGQLGDGTLSDRLTPVQVSLPALTYKAVGAGYQHSCALAGGLMYCWGANDVGQLGNGTTTSSATPVLVSAAPSPFVGLSVGDNHTCAVTQDAKIYCWGFNDRGQLGNGSTTNASAPVAVSSTSLWKQVSAGGLITCGVTTAGGVFCWGDNKWGAIGNGTTSSTPVTTPTSVSLPAGTSFEMVTAGFNSACAVSTGGQAYCWGANTSGKLGNNSTTDSPTPVPVSGNQTWKLIRAGRNDTVCGVNAQGRPYCWGSNFTGQLGDGTFNDASVPVPVFTAFAFSTIQAGDVHTCGISTSGIGYCWGNNERGELGNGTTTIKTTPVAVLTGPATAPPVVAGAPAASGWPPAELARREPRAGSQGSPKGGTR